MDYDLYHDESQEGGYWHGILLVPRPTRAALLELLARIRTNTQRTEPVTLKGLKDTGSRFRCVRGWVSVAVAALIQDFKRKPAFVETGVKQQGVDYAALKELIRARFILFRVRDAHQDMSGFKDHAAKIETTFGMGLKGGLHLFANDHEFLRLCSYHFDGHEHYGRCVDANRIARRLRNLRVGVGVAEDCFIDDRSSDHREPDAQAYDDCQLLQLTDALVSGFRTVLGSASNEVQAQVAAPLLALAAKWHDGYPRMRNSRWFRCFCISECWLEQEQWQFGDIQPRVALARQAELGF